MPRLTKDDLKNKIFEDLTKQEIYFIDPTHDDSNQFFGLQFGLWIFIILLIIISYIHLIWLNVFIIVPLCIIWLARFLK